MYSSDLKKIAQQFENAHIPEDFKFGEFDNGVEMMEVYEELFDYAFEIKNDYPLCSNFTYFSKNIDLTLKLLKNVIDKDDEKRIICEICYKFCFEIKNYFK